MDYTPKLGNGHQPIRDVRDGWPEPIYHTKNTVFRCIWLVIVRRFYQLPLGDFELNHVK